MKNRKGKIIVSSDKEERACISKEISYALSETSGDAFVRASWYAEYTFIFCNIIKPLALLLLSKGDDKKSFMHKVECERIVSHLKISQAAVESKLHKQAAELAFNDMCSNGKLNFMIDSTIIELGVHDESTAEAMKDKILKFVLEIKTYGRESYNYLEKIQ